MVKYIIASSHPDAGLSNKLKCLISVLRLADKLDRIPLLNWDLNFTCGADFNELFRMKINRISQKRIKMLEKENKLKRCSSFEDCKTDKDFILFDDWRFVLLPGEVKKEFAKVFPNKTGKSIDLEYERIPKKIVKSFLKYIKMFVPEKEILERVELFEKKYDLKDVIGLHVRRTEFLLNKDGRGFVSTDEKFFNRMNEILKKNRKTRFFLATDSKKTEKNFIKKFGDRIIIMKTKDWSKSSSQSIKDALVEMLILSKTKIILGTYLSSFTEMAWWFGKCNPKVEIIGDAEQKRLVLQRAAASPEIAKVNSGLIRDFLRFLRRKSWLFRKFLEFIMEYKVRNK